MQLSVDSAVVDGAVAAARVAAAESILPPDVTWVSADACGSDAVFAALQHSTRLQGLLGWICHDLLRVAGVGADNTVAGFREADSRLARSLE
jgi:hypothetical protein